MYQPAVCSFLRFWVFRGFFLVDLCGQTRAKKRERNVSTSVDHPFPCSSRNKFVELWLAKVACSVFCSFLYFLPERALTNINPLYLFFSGFIAISALVVPGISGSFILLLMGSYQSILMAVRDLDLVTLFIFLGGALLGLLSIVRLIKLLYDQQKEFLLAVFFVNESIS